MCVSCINEGQSVARLLRAALRPLSTVPFLPCGPVTDYQVNDTRRTLSLQLMPWRSNRCTSTIDCDDICIEPSRCLRGASSRCRGRLREFQVSYRNSLKLSSYSLIWGLRKITTAMRDSFAWAGVEKVYLPMLSRTVNRCVFYGASNLRQYPTQNISSSSKKSAAFLDCIISANSPQTLVQALIKLILRVKVLANDGDGGKFPALLSATFQRHEQAFRSAVEELFADNSIAKNDLDNILLGVSSV